MRSVLLLLLSIFIGQLATGQSITEKSPRLIVGIVVDQMRFDHLYKYQEKYSENGFKRLMRDGYNFKNMHYNYVPTVTAAGHASIYTGTTPAFHGIIGNSWFDRNKNATVGNVDDSASKTIGTKVASTSGASPKNMLSTTIADQMRLASNFKSKTISISLKDRGAILPGGRSANAAYWFDTDFSPGYFVSSTYYMNSLPKWATDFNALEKANAFLNETWTPLYPIETYTESAPDKNRYERAIGGKRQATFPYDFKNLREKYKALNAEYQLMLLSPAGNTILTDFAMEAIKGEDLGKDSHTDLLNISYSVPDIVGHTLGPQSVEAEDIYLRLDQNIADLLLFLDNNVGKQNYTLFLTSDHAAIPTASYLNDRKLPTGIARTKQYKEALTQYLDKKYRKNSWIQYFEYEQVYLNRQAIAAQGLDLNTIQKDAANFLSNLDGIHTVLTANNLKHYDYNNGIKRAIQNGFYAKRSGDLLLSFDPGIIQDVNSEIAITTVKGTTHGSGYSYDTHVPMLWYGARIPQGSSVKKVEITSIAPSIALLLNIQFPSGSEGRPLIEIFE